MKKLVPRAAFLAILLILVINLPQVQAQQPPTVQSDSQTARPIPYFFFGMKAQGPKHWPIVPFWSARLHDTQTGWTFLNPSPGVYDWTHLDRWIAASQQQGAGPLLYTFSQTPQWASSNPNDTTCQYGPGQCDPPNDLNPDGTGTNQHWKDFVTALANHAAAANKVRFWEMWNEPANSFYWTGTQAQLVRMSKDARAIILSVDPGAKLLSSPNPYFDEWYRNWWASFTAAGGFQYADIIALHGGVAPNPRSCGQYPVASDFLTLMADIRTLLSSYGVDKPIWDTESNWGNTDQDCFDDPDLQSAFLAQFYLFHRSAGLRRFYWSTYDSDTAPLFDVVTGTLREPGVAYQQVHGWMLGSTMLANSCSSVGTIWTCGLTAPKGYKAQAIWDTAESCGGGVCQAINYQVDASFIQYRTLSGDTFAISNHQVPIGAKPILVENKTR